jgi:hypothetical protein
MGKHSILKVKRTLNNAKEAALAQSGVFYKIFRALVNENTKLDNRFIRLDNRNAHLVPLYIRYTEALATAMRPHSFNHPLYRGLREPENHFTSKATRKTFASFTPKLEVAKGSSIGTKQVLKLNNPQNIPSLIYGQNGYESRFPGEREVLLPPGTFTRINNNQNIIQYIGGDKRFPNKYHIIPVRFNVNQAFMKDPNVHILPKYKARNHTPNNRAPKNTR